MANAVNDVWRCVLEWSESEETGMIVLHRKVTLVNDTSEDVLGAALALRMVDLGDDWASDLAGTGVNLVCATAQRINVANPTRIYTVFSSTAPSIGSTAVPPQAAVLASVYPAAAALIKSGRSYFPFLDAAHQAAGEILSASQAAIEAAIEPLVKDLITIASVAELKAVLWRTVGQIAVEITSSVLRPVLASQRRRVVAHQKFT